MQMFHVVPFFLLAAAAAAVLINPSPLPSGTTSATFRISNVFGTHMVLQRDRPTVLWGFAEPGTQVFVSLTGRGVTVKLGPSTTDSSSVWRLSHSPRAE